MPQPKICIHLLFVEPDKQPNEQRPKQVQPKLASKVEIEVDKFIKVDLIWEVQHPN